MLSFVSVFRAGVLLLTKFLLSPQNKQRPIFPEQGHIWTLLKQLQPSACLTLPRLGVPEQFQAVSGLRRLLPSLLCLGTGQNSAPARRWHRARSHTPFRSIPWDGCNVLVPCSEQCSHPEPSAPPGARSTALGAGPVPPSPRHLLQGLDLLHPL